jgi:hypothetical protein
MTILFLLPKHQNTADFVATYIVDHNTNVRIMTHALTKAGLDIARPFQFNLDGDKVILSNA